MKILHISTSDRGGAANAGIRLHRGLRSKGIESKFLVLKKFKNTDHSYTFRNQFLLNKPKNFWNRLLKESKFKYEQFKLRGQPKGYEMFSFADSWFDIRQSKLFQEADIINLHWVAGFINYPTFFKNHSKPVIWTLHDMNPFTGGCHYSYACQAFEKTCGECPQLLGTQIPTLAQSSLKTKEKALSTTNLTIVSPSKWLSNLASKSHLFKSFPNFCVPNSIDFQVFKKTSQEKARQILGLPQGQKILFFTAQDTDNPRKGFQLLYKALPMLKDENLIVFMAGKKVGFSTTFAKIIEAGTINDPQKMALAYSASDIFVIPSLEDNLPNTVLESLACGTPVVGFNIGGIPDMIIPQKNGILVHEVSSENLAKALHHILNHLDHFDRNQITMDCYAKYALDVQAQAYINIYEKVLGK